MSPVCQRRHRTKVVDDTDGWQIIAVEDRKAKIPELAAFRIDFARWLKTLTWRDRRIVNRLAGGDRTMEVADRFGITEEGFRT